MARPLRIEYPGAVYHITTRGNARQVIYLDNDDRVKFIDTLAETVDRFHWRCHAYCLMDNHYHLLIETPEGNLAEGMHYLNGVYTQAFNRHHQSCGHLFQGRYKAILVEKQSHLLELVRYVMLNPVRAGIVERPDDYSWSSYRQTLGLEKVADFLTVDWILDNFSAPLSEGQKQFQRFVLDGIKQTASPWDQLAGQIFLGSYDFAQQVKKQLSETTGTAEIPRAQRYHGRPSLTDLLPADNKLTKKQRNRLICTAQREHGYKLKEIADHLGLHYTTVSKVVNQGKR